MSSSAEEWESALQLSPQGFCRKVYIDWDDWQRAVNNPIYIHFSIAKRSGGKRRIHSPDKRLKRVQRGIVTAMSSWYYDRLPDAVYGFIPKAFSKGVPRHVRTNAGRHGVNSYLLNVDIDNFFPSITEEKLAQRWLDLWPQTSAALLADLRVLLCYKGKLPTGAPSSPLLSNWYTLPLDKNLEAFAKTCGLTYTRYVDDMSFSSQEKWPVDVEPRLVALIEAQGFRLNADKRRWYGYADEKVVTGIRFNGGLLMGLHVEKEFIKNFRRCLKAYQRHIWWQEVNGSTPHVKHKLRWLRQSIRGQLAYCAHVQGERHELVLTLKQEWKSIQKKRLAYYDGYHRIT